MLYQSVEKLRTLRLTGMAHALEAQLTQADIARLSFDERLAMLIDREEIDRHNAALAQRLRLARLREAACFEDIDYRKPRGLDRSLLRSLATGQWLSEHNNVLVLGKTGTGKSYIACALGNQAARDGHSVRYQRLSRLLDELAMGRAEGRYASILARLSKVKLLILDDWLMAKLTADQRRDLMEVIDDVISAVQPCWRRKFRWIAGMNRLGIRPTEMPSSIGWSTTPIVLNCADHRCDRDGLNYLPTKRRMKTKISVKISPLLTLLTNRPHQQQGRIVER